MYDAERNWTAKQSVFFAYSSKREQSNERSGTRSRFTDFLTDFEKKKPTVLQPRTEPKGQYFNGFEFSRLGA